MERALFCHHLYQKQGTLFWRNYGWDYAIMRLSVFARIAGQTTFLLPDPAMNLPNYFVPPGHFRDYTIPMPRLYHRLIFQTIQSTCMVSGGLLRIT